MKLHFDHCTTAKTAKKKQPLESNLLVTALDEIACGVLILNAHGALIHSNLAGQVHLAGAKHLQINEAGLLVPLETKDAPALEEAIAKALNGKRSMINLGKSSITTLAVVPLDRHIDRKSDHWLDRRNFDQAQRVALIFSRSGMCENLMMSFFARAYHLTHSEEQILSLICVGQTAPEMARELRVGEATVRTHIRSICQKTHSHGIREVTKRLALLPPLMAAVMPGAFA